MKVPLEKDLTLVQLSVIASPGRRRYLPVTSISDCSLPFPHLPFNVKHHVIFCPLIISNSNYITKNFGGILEAESHKEGKNLKCR